MFQRLSPRQICCLRTASHCFNYSGFRVSVNISRTPGCTSIWGRTLPQALMARENGQAERQSGQGGARNGVCSLREGLLAPGLKGTPHSGIAQRFGISAQRSFPKFEASGAQRKDAEDAANTQGRAEPVIRGNERRTPGSSERAEGAKRASGKGWRWVAN